MIDEQMLLQLRERIALCRDFSPDERTLILDCMNLGDYSGKHEYPSQHMPGSSPWTTAAWEILDKLRPDALKSSDRFMLGGMIAGALQEMFKAGREAAAGITGKNTEIYAPQNPRGQIDALYAALSADDAGEGLCAGPIGEFGVAPLVVAERRHLPVITDIARAVGRVSKKTIRIVRFTLREDLETIEPA